MPDSDGKSRILSEIADDARKEAAALIDEAKKLAGERTSFAKIKADNIIKEAHKKAQSQAEQVRQSVLSSVAVELKRDTLRMQDKVIQTILAKVQTNISDAIQKDNYTTILSQLITEAATGLDTTSMTVNASAQERELIDDKMLKAISLDVAGRSHHPVTIQFTTDPPLQQQGVVVTASDGRTAFNNQFNTRMRRFEQQIRNRIYDVLFSASPSKNDKNKQTDQS